MLSINIIIASIISLILIIAGLVAITGKNDIFKHFYPKKLLKEYTILNQKLFYRCNGILYFYFAIIFLYVGYGLTYLNALLTGITTFILMIIGAYCYVKISDKYSKKI